MRPVYARVYYLHMTPREKLHAMLAATFRTLSASSDRALAGEAIRLESKVLALLSPESKPKPRRRMKAA